MQCVATETKRCARLKVSIVHFFIFMKEDYSHAPRERVIIKFITCTSILFSMCVSDELVQRLLLDIKTVISRVFHRHFYGILLHVFYYSDCCYTTIMVNVLSI